MALLILVRIFVLFIELHLLGTKFAHSFHFKLFCLNECSFSFSLYYYNEYIVTNLMIINGVY